MDTPTIVPTDASCWLCAACLGCASCAFTPFIVGAVEIITGMHGF